MITEEETTRGIQEYIEAIYHLEQETSPVSTSALAELGEDACRLEHATSQAVEERLAKALGDPKSYAHGHPVPSSEGELPPETAVSLTELELHQGALIRQVTREYD